MRPTFIVPLLALGLLAGCAEAQMRPAATAVTLEQALAVPVQAAAYVVELADGRVAFADTRARLALRADLATGRVDTIGARADTVRADDGGVYRLPGVVVKLGGDTLGVVDFAALRTTVWGEDGSFRGVRRFAPIGGATPVLSYDAAGYGYKVDYQAVLGGGEPGSAVRPDSVPVLRLRPEAVTADTVGYLAAPDYGDAMFGEQMQQVAMVFGPNDLTGVLPDGSLWIARARTYSVDWRSPDGRWTRGAPRDFPKVPVTDADKDRVLEGLKAQPGFPKNIPIRYPFAATKPSFERALGNAYAGEVWLQQPRAAPDGPTTYGVFGRDGRWSRDVTLPAGTTLLGFGRDGALYAAARTPAGTLTLGRYREAAAR